VSVIAGGTGRAGRARVRVRLHDLGSLSDLYPVQETIRDRLGLSEAEASLLLAVGRSQVQTGPATANSTSAAC
jgi:hypothetical protein